MSKQLCPWADEGDAGELRAGGLCHAALFAAGTLSPLFFREVGVCAHVAELVVKEPRVTAVSRCSNLARGAGRSWWLCRAVTVLVAAVTSFTYITKMCLYLIFLFSPKALELRPLSSPMWGWRSGGTWEAARDRGVLGSPASSRPLPIPLPDACGGGGSACPLLHRLPCQISASLITRA